MIGGPTDRWRVPTGVSTLRDVIHLCRHPARGGRPTDTALDQRQPHDRGDVVVRGDAAVPLEPATEAAVDDRLLAVAPREDADRRHARAALAGPIARDAPVDVQRVQAGWAVIAVPPAKTERTRMRAAVPAPKSFT